MATSSPVNILLAHDQWATRQMLEACRGLTDEQFHRRFEMGPGSMHDTVTHILGALGAWGDTLAGRGRRPRPEGTTRTVDELVAMHDVLSADLLATATSQPVDEVVSREFGGKTYSFTRGGVITHVTTHGMHHRAQCLNMLRQMGVKLPLSSVLDWMLKVDHPQ